jgi:hypothetical protein
MTWWLTSHRYLVAVAVSLGCVALGALLGEARLLVPTASGGVPFGELPVFAVLPLLVPIVVGTALDGAERPPYVVSARRVYRYDVLFSSTFVLIYAAASILVVMVWPELTATLPGLRNLVAFIGLQLVSGWWLPYRYQSSVPTIYVLAAATFGRADQGGVSAWAWPLESSTTPMGFAFAVSLLAVGMMVSLHRGDRGRLRHW